MHFFIPLFTKKEVHRESDQGTNHRPKIPSYWPLRHSNSFAPRTACNKKALRRTHSCLAEPQYHTGTLTGPLQIPLPRSHQPLLRDDGLGINQWVGSNSTGNYLYLLHFINFSLSFSLELLYFILFQLFQYPYLNPQVLPLFQFSSPSHQGGREQVAAWYLSGLKPWKQKKAHWPHCTCQETKPKTNRNKQTKQESQRGEEKHENSWCCGAVVFFLFWTPVQVREFQSVLFLESFLRAMSSHT